MLKSFRLRHVSVAAMLTFAMLAQGTWALAGTTGGITGTIVDAETHAPVADAKVTATSPSESGTTRTDAAGHFTFLSLTPDTYTVSAEKDQYSPISQPGITVFADTNQSVTLSMQKALKTIARVTSRAASDLVKSGTTSDVYSVNAATQDKISALGGGGNLNSAYAAVASVPGAVMPVNQAGYFQTVHIRGGDYDQVGYEFDGVPVNRSFDNYPSGQLSSLGMSELQVYTGATPANSEGQGLAGYINQVIKSGTYPGFATFTGGIGTPTYYHKFAVETGGASPNRLFSYYVGVGGYNQDFRYVDVNNAVNYSDPALGIGPPLVQLPPPDVASFGDPCTGSAVDVNYSYCYANGFAGPGGYLLAPYNFAQPSSIWNRDVVVNVHFGIPHHHDTGRDDVQLLWDSGMLLNGFYESTNDTYGAAGYPANSNNPGPPFYYDGFLWTGPVGGPLPANYSANVTPYLYPDSAPHPAFSFTGATTAINPNQRDTTWNDQEIVKLQYQHNFGSSAYVRLYGYTYYSDWLNNGPNCAFQNYVCAVSPDYELSSHTRGASLTFADQLSSQHLLQIEGNYTTANSIRDNNTQMFNAFGRRSLGAILVNSKSPTSGVCYNAAAPGTGVSCDADNASVLTWPCMQDPVNNPFCDTTSYTSPAAVAGLTCGTGPCEYLVAENSLYATYNQVVPEFSSVSIQDEWRPTGQLLFNFGLRGDRFHFKGADTGAGNPARQFWFNAFNTDNCVAPDGFSVIPKTSVPGFAPGADITTACSDIAAGYTTPKLVNASSQAFTYDVLEPRFSGTVTVSPNTVVRFSAGRYVEPPNTAYEQYNTLQENLPGFIGPTFYKFGFTTPGHEVRPPTSSNFDVSWEQRIPNTAWSLKLTPFYRKTQDQIQNFFLDQQTGFISGLNVGRQTSEGLEFQVNEGDFNANGISGTLALTYTHSFINYDKLSNGTTIVDQINADIKTYNAYTSFCATHTGDTRCGATNATSGGSAACFTPAGEPDTTGCAAGDVANPYWNAPVQGLLNPNADYPTYDIFPGGIGGSAVSFAIPYAATLVLNYKHDKFAITPSFQFLGGNRYGSPETSPGVDPASGAIGASPCVGLAGSTTGDPRYPYGAAGGAPYDATSCGNTIVIPNPYTKGFDQPGAFVQPNVFMMNMQLSYDVSPKLTLVGTFANLVNTCWGGTKEPWTVNDGNICSYGIVNSAGSIPPVGNVFNPGAAIQPLVQFPYGRYLGPVNVDGFSTKMPFNFFLEARLKL